MDVGESIFVPKPFVQRDRVADLLVLQVKLVCPKWSSAVKRHDATTAKVIRPRFISCMRSDGVPRVA